VAAAGTGRARQTRGAAEARVTAMLARHGATLRRVARQASLCEDDASDAVQRALEIYVRRLDTVEVATEAAWLKVVVRHEAYAIRASRADTTVDPELHVDAPAADRSVEEQVLSSERVSRSAEALRSLKPDEARALMLKAHGLSYEEIGRHCGWTYTKVNRSITEGRRRFMEAYAALEAGDTCERFAGALAALAGGRATSEQLVELRPHLRHCTACRATVRDLHRSRRRGLRVLLPLPLLAWLRREAATIGHRLGSSDVGAAAQWLATVGGGGGRFATLGAVIGLCVSGMGAAAVCVVTGVVRLPLLTGPVDVERHRPHHVARVTPTPGAVVSVSVVRPTPRVPPRPTATPTPTPGRRAAPARDRSQERTPTAHRSTPIAPAPPAIVAEFSAAPAAGTGTRTPAARAPATGGGEFSP
jgi:RNA polymerase sigma factor (sigma-70 family)